MIFPFEDEETEELEEEGQYLPREYGVNFDTGQLSGKIAEGVDAVAVWAWLALQTERCRYYVYSLAYGQDYEEMIGKGYSSAYIDAELKRMTEDCLLENPYITGIENFVCEASANKVHVSFTIITDFGETEVSASV